MGPEEIVKANADYEAGKTPDPKLMAAVAKQAEEHTKAGTMLSTRRSCTSSVS